MPDDKYVLGRHLQNASNIPAMVLQELRKRQRSGDEAQQLQPIDSVRSQEEELPREEVIRRLRLLGQPITLFGEVCCCGLVSVATWHHLSCILAAMMLPYVLTISQCIRTPSC